MRVMILLDWSLYIYRLKVFLIKLIFECNNYFTVFTSKADTVLKMSVSSESTASSEDPGLWEKVFLAGCRTKFVGKRRDQFSKNEISTMNIVRLL